MKGLQEEFAFPESLLQLLKNSHGSSQVMSPDVTATYNSGKEDLSRQTKLLYEITGLSSTDKVKSTGWHIIKTNKCPDIARTS